MEIYKKLGFSHLETSKVVKALDSLLANYQVHYQKLRSFHWNVEGSAFFELHQEFEKEYKEVMTNIDKIAERIRTFGYKPYSTMATYLRVSEIKERGVTLSSRTMVKDILNDFEILLSYMVTTIQEANAIGDTGTSHMVMGFVERMEKRHWMFSAWLKKSTKPQEPTPTKPPVEPQNQEAKKELIEEFILA